MDVEKKTEVATAVAEMARTGASFDDIAAFLRKSGCSITEAVSILAVTMKWTTGKSQTVILDSPAWADIRQLVADLHADLPE